MPGEVGLLPGWLRRLGYYGLALLLVAGAAGLRTAMPEVLQPAPTLVFYLAWVGAAAFGGLGPGLLASVASWWCIVFLFDSTPGQMNVTEPESAGRLIVFLAGGLVVSAVGEKMRRTRLRERRQKQELAVTNAALCRSEERYRHLFFDDLTGDFLATPDGRTVEVNPAFATIYGFADTAGAVAYDLSRLNPEDWTNLVARVQRERLVRGHETRHRRLDGTEIWVVANMVGRFNDAGQLTGIQGYVFDDTERKQAEQALRELTRTLESRVAQRTRELKRRAKQLQSLVLEVTEAEDRERKRLAEILHDDLQQILAAAKFQLSLVEKNAASLEKTQAVVPQVQELLKEAIDKSRSLSHELSAPVLSQSNLSEAFEWLAQQIQTKHGLTVHLEIEGRIELTSEPLRVLLYKAAQELLFNVVKHAGVGEATLRLRRHRGCIRLCVSDRGRGFDAAKSDSALGYGLLSIRERVGFLGGRLKIRSTVGQGSTFLIMVPDAGMDRT